MDDYFATIVCSNFLSVPDIPGPLVVADLSRDRQTLFVRGHRRKVTGIPLKITPSHFFDSFRFFFGNLPQRERYYKIILDARHGGSIRIFYRKAQIIQFWAENGVMPFEEDFVDLLKLADQQNALINDDVKLGDGKFTPLCSSSLKFDTIAWNGSEFQEDFDKKTFANVSIVSCVPSMKQDAIHEALKVIIATKKQDTDTSKKFIDSVLVLDDEAPRVDTRVLTFASLENIPILTLHPTDYFLWTVSAMGPISKRRFFKKLESNPNFKIPRNLIKWRAIITTTLVETMDALWYFVVDSSNFASSDISLATYSSVCRFLGEASYSVIMQQSWRVNIKPSLMRIQYFDLPNAEKNVLRGILQKDMSMGLLGFLRNSQGEFSTVPYKFKCAKRTGTLHASLIESCLEGFVCENAKKLLGEAQQCTICCDAESNAFLDKCGHIFCARCITQMLEMEGGSSHCPSCRQPFSAEEFSGVRSRGKKPADIPSPTLRTKLSSFIEDELNPLILVPSAAVQIVREWFPDDRVESSEVFAEGNLCYSIILCDIPENLDALHRYFQERLEGSRKMHVFVQNNEEYGDSFIRKFSSCYGSSITSVYL